MKRKIVSIIAAVMIASTILSGCSSSSSGSGSSSASSAGANQLTKVTFVGPSALASFSYVAIYAADYLGYFKQEGIDLQIEQAIGTTDCKMVATGQAQFGYPSPGVSLASIDAGLPITSVGQVDPINIFGVAVQQGGSIKTWSDLKGKTIVLGDASWKNIITPVIKAAGVDPNSVKFVVASDGRYQMLSQGKVDGMVTWISEFKQLQGQGFKFSMLNGEDVLKECANSIVTNTEYAKQNPAIVKGFVRAFAKACYFLKENPQAAADITLNKEPSIKISWDGAVSSVQGVIQSYFGTNDAQTKETMSNGICFMEKDRWQKALDAQIEVGAVKNKLDLSKVFTNAYVDTKWDKSKVEQDAKDYKCTSAVYTSANGGSSSASNSSSK